jgi:hypothetical protein
MGRPIQKKFFGNTNTPAIGGEGVASVTLGTLGSYTTRPTVTFSAPDLAGADGVTATGTVTSEVLSATISGGAGYGNAQTFNLTVANAAGETAVLNVTSEADGTVITVNSITTRGTFTALTAVVSVAGGTGTGAVPVLTYRAKAVVITNAGSGYTDATDAAPTFTQSVTGTSVLTAVKQNAITISAFVPGGSSAVVGDIVKQTASRAYRVTTAQGTGRCDLVAAAPAAGQMTMTAVDSAGGTYYVIKLTARRALLIKGDRTGTQFTTGTTGISIPWSLDAAILNERVQILNA